MTDPVEPEPPPRHGRLRGVVRRHRRLTGLAAAAVAAAVVVALTDPFSGPAPSNAGVTDNAYPTGTTTITEGTILSQTEVSATLGYAGTYSIALPSGTPAATVRQDRTTVQTDQASVAADQHALTQAKALAGPSDASTLRSARAAVRNDTTALADAKDQLAADRRLSCPASSSATVTSSSSPGNATSPGETSPGNATSPGGTSPGNATSPGGTSPGNATSPGGTSPGNATSPGGTSPGNATSPGGTSPGNATSPGGTSPGNATSPGGTSPGNATSPGGTSPGNATSGAHARLDAATITAPTAGPATASASGGTTATASATVNPNGSATTYEFEYGTTSALGSTTRAQSAGAGTSPATVSGELTGLRAGATYEVALVATNAKGTIVGTIGTFAMPRSSCVAQSAVVAEDATTLANAKNALAADHLDANSTLSQDRQTLATDEQTLADAERALSSDEHRQLSTGATVTGVPKVGQVIHRGQAAYFLDGKPVPLLYGSLTPYRDLYLGVSPGHDVLALERNLVALGFLHAPASRQFSAATQAAVEAWQRSLGVAATGRIALGDVAYAPGAIQVDTVTATTGEAATGGAAVLTATSTTPEVTIALDASQQSSVHVGDPVSIVLPDNATTPGVVSSVGSVATTPSGSSGNGPSSPTVAVEVTPTKPTQLGHLDQASVNVWITVAKVAHADVVPVDALLALASGGYGLEAVGANGARSIVGVHLGLFDDANGTVQVSGAGVRVGERVVVPKL